MQNFLKSKWQKIAIVFLLLSLAMGILPASADVIKIQPNPSLDDLRDVNATSPNDNDVLTWDIALNEWVSASPGSVVAANQTGRSVTYTVAASDAPDLIKTQADYVCAGSDDQNTIQSALDALPAGGGWVALSLGTFNVSGSINLDSNQMLSGCGFSTIITATVLGEFFMLEASGADGSELVGIVISNLKIDGANMSSICIAFQYVDESYVQNVWAINTNYDTGGLGIDLADCDSNHIVNNYVGQNPYYGIEVRETSSNNVIAYNICPENADGIAIYDASDNVIMGNTCLRNSDFGIVLNGACRNTVIGNDCSYTGLVQYSQSLQGYGIGLWGSSNYNVIQTNTCKECARDGIRIDGSGYNIIESNICLENSQEVGGNNTYSDIILNDADYNNIQVNICQAGSLANKPKYGIDISSADCDGNKVINNALYDDGFGTAPYYNAGTDTIYIEPVELQSNLSSLNNTVISNTNAISSLNSTVINNRGNITVLQGNVTTIWGNLTALNSTVAGNSGNITGLKSIAIIYVIDGGGSAITTGQKGYLDIPFACTITSWTLLADQSGSMVIDVWKDTYANFPPTVADNITGSEKPTLSSVQKNQDLNLTTWNTTISSGDVLAFNVDSCTTVTRVTLTITATRVI